VRLQEFSSSSSFKFWGVGIKAGDLPKSEIAAVDLSQVRDL
jgi:hypothetical protein